MTSILNGGAWPSPSSWMKRTLGPSAPRNATATVVWMWWVCRESTRPADKNQATSLQILRLVALSGETILESVAELRELARRGMQGLRDRNLVPIDGCFPDSRRAPKRKASSGCRWRRARKSHLRQRIRVSRYIAEDGIDSRRSLTRAGKAAGEIDPTFVEAIDHANTRIGVAHSLTDEQTFP